MLSVLALLSKSTGGNEFAFASSFCRRLYCFLVLVFVAVFLLTLGVSTAGVRLVSVFGALGAFGFLVRIFGVWNFCPLFFWYIQMGMNKIMAVMIRHNVAIFLLINFAMAIYSCSLSPH